MTHELAQGLHSVEGAPSVLALKGDDVMAGTRGDTALEPEPEPLRDRGAG